MKKLALVLAASMVLSMGLSACGGSSSSSSTPGSSGDAQTPSVSPDASELAVCIGPDPETIDPALNSASDGSSLIKHAFEGLLRTDPNGDLGPGQAESYDVSPDGLTWTFHLREGLKWSDGSPLTAADFEYSWKRAVDPMTAAPYADMFNVIAGYHEAVGSPDAEGNATADPNPDALQVKAVDDNTLEVKLDVPCAYFDQLAAFPSYYPVQKATIEANGDAWATMPESYIGNGPYTMIEWVPGEYIKYAKNENYWDYESLGSDVLKFVLMEDPNAILSAYQNGSIVCAKDIPGQEVPKLSSTPDFHLDDLLGTYYISFNTKKAPFDNVDVRKALSLAIDRKYVAEKVMQGTYEAAGNYIGPGLMDADGKTPFFEVSGNYIDINNHEANLAQAKELLAKAGYPNGEGFPAVEYMTNEASYHKPLAEALQQMWGELGVKLDIQIVEWSILTPNRREGNFDIARNGWLCDYNDPYTMLSLFETTNGNNDGKYSNPEFDKLMETVRGTDDQEVRFKAMHEAEKLLMDDAAMAPAAYYKEFYLLNPNVKGFYHSPLGHFYFMYATVG